MIKYIQHKKENISKVKTPQKNIFQQSECKKGILFKEKSKGQLYINAICQRIVKAETTDVICERCGTVVMNTLYIYFYKGRKTIMTTCTKK